MVDMSIDDNYEGDPMDGIRLKEKLEAQRQEAWELYGPCPHCGFDSGDLEVYTDGLGLICWDCGRTALTYVDDLEDWFI